MLNHSNAAIGNCCCIFPRSDFFSLTLLSADPPPLLWDVFREPFLRAERWHGQCPFLPVFEFYDTDVTSLEPNCNTHQKATVLYNKAYDTAPQWMFISF